MDILPVLRKDNLIVVSSHNAARDEIATLSAELALRGSVTVLDGGNCFPFYRFARLIRSKTFEGAIAVKRLFIRRAFTCYQMLELLSSTQALDQPYLVLNLLATFYDEQVPEREIRRLLDACLVEANRLSMTAPVLISLSPPRLPERTFLAEQICQSADKSFMLDASVPEFVQPALF
jgi:hypothetical protein